MLSKKHFDDLQHKGYTVVSGVLTHAECDDVIGHYQQWLSQFKDGAWPTSHFSLIQHYNSGNMHPTWSVRLKTKPIWLQIWKTDKLLTSVDAIAIGRPPEDGEEPFHKPGSHWLHLDQYPPRVGLHAIQGGVYLEDTDVDDWTLEVLEGSHLHHKQHFRAQSLKAEKSQVLNDDDILNYLKWGCVRKRIPVPKGGIILWDSRLVHANARPMKGRKHPGRWRWCVFVSMTPAIWATEKDIQIKKIVYENAYMTSHWSSMDISYYESVHPTDSPEVKYPRELPDIAKTDECKRLCGVLPYDFNDGQPTGKELTPKFENVEEIQLDNNWVFRAGMLSLYIAVVGVVYAIYRVRSKT